MLLRVSVEYSITKPTNLQKKTPIDTGWFWLKTAYPTQCWIQIKTSYATNATHRNKRIPLNLCWFRVKSSHFIKCKLVTTVHKLFKLWLDKIVKVRHYRSAQKWSQRNPREVYWHWRSQSHNVISQCYGEGCNF